MTANLRTANKRTIWLVAGVLAGLVGLLVLFGRFLFLPKILMVALILLAALLLGRIRPFVRDWFVFMSFIYLFDSLRGTIYILTCKLQSPVYAVYVLNVEKALFGGVPSLTLQRLLLRPDPLGNFTWLERILTVCYGSHFIAFLFVGFLIWLARTKSFSLYKSSFYLLIFLGELVYALVPTVPPWMAASHFGLIPPLTRFNVILFNFVIPDITSGFDTNPISAMPSLHAGFPILCSLLLWRLYRWKGLPFYLYTLSVLFAIVYSGDHYVSDILAGLVLAVACYAVAVRILKKRPAFGDDRAEGEASFGGVAMKKRLLFGLAVFLAGIVIGGINKTQFVLHTSSYNLDVPRYVDFFRTSDRYEASYPVQTYFGNHFLSRNDHRTALGYFERSLELAREPAERKETQAKIWLCLKALGRKS